MESKDSTLESYPDPYTRMVFWEASHLIKNKRLVKIYDSKFLKVLQFVLDSKFAYYRCEITVNDNIMSLELENTIGHEDRE